MYGHGEKQDKARLARGADSERQSGERAAAQLVDNRPEASLVLDATRAPGAPGRLRDNRAGFAGPQAPVSTSSVSSGLAPVQRRIDDPGQQTEVGKYVAKLFGTHASRQTIEAVTLAVIAEASSVEEAKELAAQKKYQRGSLDTREATTGTAYNPDLLSTDKSEAMAAFSGLPGYTDPSKDGKYFTWHHLVPQSRLTGRAAASRRAAVRLGPSASHRYGDPGNDYTDPNFAEARDGSLTPVSESIEAYNESIKKQGGLAALLTSKLETLAAQVDSDTNKGIKKPLADPNQWMIFGSFLRKLPGMNADLLAELEPKLGTGYTVNKGVSEGHEFASWADLKKKGEGVDGVSDALFKVLDAGIKKYQEGELKPKENGGKIFARGYKEGDPARIESARRKKQIDAAWLSGEGAEPNLKTMLDSLADVKNKLGPVIVRGNTMVSTAVKLNKHIQTASTATGEKWQGTEHVIAPGSGKVKVDEALNKEVLPIIAGLVPLSAKLLQHEVRQGEAPSEAAIFNNYRYKVPEPGEPQIADLSQDELVVRLAELKKVIKKRKGDEGLKSKERSRKGIVINPGETKRLEQIAKAADRNDFSKLQQEAKKELAQAARQEQDKAYRLDVIDQFTRNQDAAIEGINATSTELKELREAGIRPGDVEQVKQMTVMAFCESQMKGTYVEWRDALRSKIAGFRLIPPPGKPVAEMTDEDWAPVELAYKKLLDQTGESSLGTLKTKIEERGAEIGKVLKLG